MPSVHLPPPFSCHLPPPFCVICHPLFSFICHPDICHPQKFILILEGVVDKELAKLVEKVNEELVMDVVVEEGVDNR